MPSFVFLLHYGDGTADPEIYGRHVWENEIFHWLKRARETEITGRQDIHKLFVTMNFGPSRVARKFAFRLPLKKTQELVRREFDVWKKAQDVPIVTMQGGDLHALESAMDSDAALEISVD